MTPESSYFFNACTHTHTHTHTHKLKNVHTLGANIWSPTVGPNDDIFVSGVPTGSSLATVTAMKPDGTMKWQFNDGICNAFSAPTVGPGGSIYVYGFLESGSTYDIYVYAIDPVNGFQEWYLALTTSCASMSGQEPITLNPPALGADGTLYVALNDLYAISSTGSLLWTFQVGGCTGVVDPGIWAVPSPSIGADGTIYLGAVQYDYQFFPEFYASYSFLYALNPDDGSVLWSHQTGSEDYSTTTGSFSPSVGNDGTIYIGSIDNHLFAMNPDGTVKWKYLTGGLINSPPAIDGDGALYFGSADNFFYSLSGDGVLKWTLLTGRLRVHRNEPQI